MLPSHRNEFAIGVATQLDPARLSRWRAADRPPRYHLFWDAGLLLMLFVALMIAGRRWRFSLRTMLIVTTLVAILLGVVSYAARN